MKAEKRTKTISEEERNKRKEGIELGKTLNALEGNTQYSETFLRCEQLYVNGEISGEEFDEILLNEARELGKKYAQ